jgi:hypothetical protein
MEQKSGQWARAIDGYIIIAPAYIKRSSLIMPRDENMK